MIMHNITDSKEFLQKLSLCAFGTSTLAALLRFISPNYLDSVIVKPNDLRLKLEFITHDAPKG
jgi:carboxymethylenebutenolidase